MWLLLPNYGLLGGSWKQRLFVGWILEAEVIRRQKKSLTCVYAAAAAAADADAVIWLLPVFPSVSMDALF